VELNVQQCERLLNVVLVIHTYKYIFEGVENKKTILKYKEM
jgi:hypothetical protein